MKFLFAKHSMKNLRRSPGKSLLYIFLITALTALLCLELSVYVSVDSFLDEADEYYTTIALYEYIGERYPNDSIFDPLALEARDLLKASPALEHEAVNVWNDSSVGLGFLHKPGSDLQPTAVRSVLPYRHEAVLLINLRESVNARGLPKAVIDASLFSQRDQTGKLVNIDTNGFTLEPHHRYVVHGEFYSGTTSEIYFRVTAFDFEAAEAADFYIDGVDTEAVIERDLALVDLGPDASAEIPDVPLMQAIANSYSLVNHSLSLIPTADLDAEMPFHQQRLTITSGRSFTAEEYKQGAGVVLLSELVAEQLDLQIGDRIDLAMADKQAETIFESYWSGTGFDHEETVEVIGIFNNHKDLQHQIYVPESDRFSIKEGQYGFTLGTAVIANDSRDAYFAAVSDDLPPSVRLSVYDQGYAAVTKSFRDIKISTLLVLGASMVAGILILLLFAYMSVYRERENGRVLIRLGASGAQVRRFFLYLPAAAAAIAVLAGAGLGIYYADEVTSYVAGLAESSRLADLRYSITNLSITRDLPFRSRASHEVFYLTALLIFVTAMIFSYLIAGRSMDKPKKARRKRKYERLPQGSSSLRGGAFAYAWLSIKRSGARAMLPLAAALAATLLLFQMSSTLTDTSEELRQVNESNEIQAYYTNIYGQQNQDLLIDLYSVRALNDSQLIDSIAVTMRRHYWYQGRYPGGGTAYIEEPMPDFGDTGFGRETMMDQLEQQPDLVFTNDLHGVSDFLYSSGVETDYMDGWSDDLFAMVDEDQLNRSVAVISRNLMDEYDIVYGDRINLMVSDLRYGTDFREVEVVGSYKGDGLDDNIYLPLLNIVSPSVLSAASSFEPMAGQVVEFESASFLIQSGHLEELKAFLAKEGFSQINRIGKQRQFIIISDASHLMTQASLTQRLNYMNVLYPVIYLITYLLALLIPFIMILVRRREITVMRQTGTQPLRVFASFFIELLLLGAIGVLAALALRRGLGLQILPAAVDLARNFYVLWLLSAGLSIVLLSKGPVRRYFSQGE